ncbi:MAG: hypothetical protein ACXWID_02695 [Pyrinomonadaceae bacterium]
MRKSISVILVAGLLLCIPRISLTQSAANCQGLREKIERIERIDMSQVSPSMQQIYREALLKLYLEAKTCVERDLAAANEIRSAVAGTSAATGVEEKFQTLTQEKAEIETRITALRTVLNIPDNAVASQTPTPEQPVVEDSNSADNPDSAPPLATAPQPGGQVTFPCLPAQDYPNPPTILGDIVTRDAKDISRGKNQGAIASADDMLLYATLDAASPTSSKLLGELEPYKYLSETARTDKQLGASANSNGSVSAIEKPGFARLLGVAIEHGGINKKNDGTNLTLSTSLYSLFTITRPDTAETYARAGFLNRIGVATTFSVTDQQNELANARRNNLSEWSVKARLFGDRSTRSSSFQRFWREEIEPLIDARLLALGKSLDELTKKDSSYRRLRVQAIRCLRNTVQTRLQDVDYKAATTEDARVKILSDLMLGVLRANVYDRIKTDQVKFAQDTIRSIEAEYVPNLRAALDNLKGAGGLIEKKLDDLNKGPLGTFAYTNHRMPTGSDYSEAKFLFEQDKSFFRPLKLTGNFGLSFYNRPDASLNQKKLRDVTAALSFDGSTRSPFTEDENQSRITYSFVGRYERLFENRRLATRKPDIGTFQFVMEIPFFKGLSLPLSATYANATEEENKKHFRFNFGMRLDTDKLFELLKAGANR